MSYTINQQYIMDGIISQCASGYSGVTVYDTLAEGAITDGNSRGRYYPYAVVSVIDESYNHAFSNSDSTLRIQLTVYNDRSYGKKVLRNYLDGFVGALDRAFLTVSGSNRSTVQVISKRGPIDGQDNISYASADFRVMVSNSNPAQSQQS